MAYTYQYPHPAVTVDCIIFALHEREIKILLIERRNEPFKNRWALPGGFVGIDEGVDTAAWRELEEETGVEKIFLEQLYTFGEPKRDPRERVISVAYYSLVKLAEHKISAGDDAINACWFPMRKLPPLAFDHEKIVAMAIKRLQGKVVYAPIIFDLLPAKFTLPALQGVYEIVLEQPLDKEDFQKRIVTAGIVRPLDEYETDGRGKRHLLHKFDKPRYQKMQESGFAFEIKPQMVRRKA
jgi:8-oxo-dGTP diphosphatase